MTLKAAVNQNDKMHERGIHVWNLHSYRACAFTPTYINGSRVSFSDAIRFEPLYFVALLVLFVITHRWTARLLNPPVSFELVA